MRKNSLDVLDEPFWRVCLFGFKKLGQRNVLAFLCFTGIFVEKNAKKE